MDTHDRNDATIKIRASRGRVGVSCHSASLAVVELTGEHDLGLHGPVKEALDDAVSQSQNLIVDLTHCAFIDSTVVRLLLYGKEVVNTSGGQFALVISADENPIARVAEIMGFIHLFALFATLEDALLAVDQGE